MPDIFNKEKRSDIMRRIHSKGNKSTELKLIAIFHEFGIVGWRRGYPVKGHPDFVFPTKKLAVFVDGCFWHGHDCRNTHPKENGEFWEKKHENNAKHDAEVMARFKARGWKVLRIWECELKKAKMAELTERLKNALEIDH